MRKSYCEREREVVAGLRRGRMGPELERHVNGCAICSDTAAVSRFVQAEIVEADAVETAPVLPDANYMWWKGQLAAKRATVERATRSIELVRKISYLAISAAALWLVFAPGHVQSFVSAISKYEVWGNDGLRQSALLIALGAMIFTVLSSLYLARAEK
jgi:hypothetical protein